VRPSKPDGGAAAGDAAACKARALDLLARREHSRAELQRKLTARGFGDDTVAAVLGALEASGALANARFTETFVRSRIARGRGPARIRAELAERGVDGGKAQDVMRAAEVDWAAAAAAALVKKFGPGPPKDFKDRARRARFLQYRGFDSGTIRAALELDADSD
jgi:regulatory protein